VRLAIVATATSAPPADCPAWTHAMIAGQLSATGISVSQVGRILAGLDLAPHQVRGWLNRRDDDQFWAQDAAVCDIYLRPPPGTVVICIDEKTGIQAKSRKHPERPPRPGRLARREFEYVRNGTLSVIAALHLAAGQVITEPIEHNDSVTFTGFLHRLDQCTDPRLNIHLVIDNGPSHTSTATRAWLAAQPRITITYTPKHASWLDMAELWFSVLTRRLLRRGEFTSPCRPRRQDHRLRHPLQPDRQALHLDLRRRRRPRPPRRVQPLRSRACHGQQPPHRRMNTHETSGPNPSRTYAGLH
jgi:transposase